MSQPTIKFAHFDQGVKVQARAHNKALPFSDFAAALSKPTVGSKDGAYILHGGCKGIRNDSNAQSATLGGIDGDSSFNPATGEVNELSAPDISLAVQALDKLGLLYVIHTSHSHMQSPKGNRWRAYIPLSRPCTKSEYQIINTAIHDAIQTAGCPVTQTKESGTFAQPWYLPRIASADAPFEFSSCIDGKAFDVDAALAAAVPDEALAAFGRLATTPPEIKAFNDKHPLDEVLRDHGYEKRGKKWIHPNSKSGAAGVWVHGELCFSHNGSDPLCDGRAHDSFDVCRILDHGGDRAAMMMAATEWEAPVPLPDLPPVQPYDESSVPQTIRAFVNDIADRMQCPPDFAVVSIITAIGSVLGCRVGVKPKMRDGWIAICNFWCAIIGISGVMKSPTMGEALAPLARLDVDARARHASAAKEAELSNDARELKIVTLKTRAKTAMRGSAKAAPDEPLAESLLAEAADLASDDVPKLRRYRTNDATYEALADLLIENPSGLLVESDEIISLLKRLDSQGQEAARGFFLTAADGDKSYVVDRIMRGKNNYVPSVCLSVAGGIQPGVLQQYVSEAVAGGAGADGLLQRFSLMVYPDITKDWRNVDQYPDKLAKDNIYNLLKWLDETPPEVMGAASNEYDKFPFFHFTSEAQPIADGWRSTLEHRLRADADHPAFISHISKYRKLMPTLALVFALCDGRRIDGIGKQATQQAIAFTAYLESHAARIYSHASHPEIDGAKKVLKLVLDGKLTMAFTMGELQRRNVSGLRAKQAGAALECLELYNWCRRESSANKRGKPTVRIIMHPDVFKIANMPIPPSLLSLKLKNRVIVIIVKPIWAQMLKLKKVVKYHFIDNTEKEITMNEQLLMCPFCGEDNMHHGSVIVFTRGLRISAPACETDDRSPGGDRDGFIVRYQCEECGNMEQHTRHCDGCTYIRWRKT